MISLHVSSMKPSALKLKEFLEKAGLKVWMCTSDLQGGDNYRNEIVNAVKTCKVFLPLINSEWANSGECADEFGLAKRQNLTSHERGITKEPELRRPIFCPVAFPNLVWTAHPHVELLAANTNFIVHDKPTLLENSDNIFQNIALSIAAFGIKMNLKAIGITVDEALLAKHSAGKQEEKASSKELIQELTATLQQQMAFLRSLEQRINNKKTVNFMEEYNPLILRARYYGGCANLHNGCEKVWALEFTFHREAQGEGAIVPLTGTMKASCIQANDHDKTEQSKAEELKMKDHIEKERHAIVELKGGFFPKSGLVFVDAQKFIENEFELIALCEYRLIINTDGTELTGVFDRGNPKWTAAVRLTAF